MEDNSLCHESFIKQIKGEIANNECFDCKGSDSEWSSINNGVLLCIKCAGIHRGLGVSISFVKSLTIDTWNEKQRKLLINGGNHALEDYFNYYSISDKEISYKYKTRAAKFYREKLDALSKTEEFLQEKPSLEEGILIIEDEEEDHEPIDKF